MPRPVLRPRPLLPLLGLALTAACSSGGHSTTAPAATASTASPSPPAAVPTSAPSPTPTSALSSPRPVAQQSTSSPAPRRTTRAPRPAVTASPTPSPTPRPTPVRTGATFGVDEVTGDRFSPDTLTLHVGDSVLVTDKDAVAPHTFTISALHVDSGGMSQGDTFRYRFTTAGRWTFVCSYHQSAGMTGTVTVLS